MEEPFSIHLDLTLIPKALVIRQFPKEFRKAAMEVLGFEIPGHENVIDRCHRWNRSVLEQSDKIVVWTNINQVNFEWFDIEDFDLTTGEPKCADIQPAR